MRALERRALAGATSPDERLNRSLLIFASALMGFGAVLWVAIYRMMGVAFPIGVPLFYLAGSFAALASFLVRLDFARYRNVQLALILFTPFAMQWSIGSFVSASGVMLWAVLAPLGVMMLESPRRAMPWFVAYATMTIMSGGFDWWLHDTLPGPAAGRGVAVFFALNFVGVSAIICLLAGFFIREKQRLRERLNEKHRELEIEQAKSERLLLSILPAPIAARLKAEQTIADAHSQVTVMFADIVGFTRMSEQATPREIVPC